MNAPPTLSQLTIWLDQAVAGCVHAPPDGYMFHAGLAHALQACFPDMQPMNISTRAVRAGEEGAPTTGASYRGVALQWGEQVFRLSTASPWLHPSSKESMGARYAEKLRKGIARQGPTLSEVHFQTALHPRTDRPATPWTEELSDRLRALVQADALTADTPAASGAASSSRL